MTTILAEIQDFLQTPLELDNKKIPSELRTVSDLRAKLATFTTDAHRTWLLAQARMRRPQEKGLTDFDRRIMTNELTVDEQHTYELALSLSELLSDRRSDLLSLYERE